MSTQSQPSAPGHLEGRDLCCIRGERVVISQLDFTLQAGEALILKGPNGSGKSTLLRLCAGLLALTRGEILWRGAPVAQTLDAYRAGLTYIGHLDAVKPVFTVAENVAFWSGLKPGAPRLAAALARLDLEDLADLPAQFLSAGQKRRVNLARLAACDAPLWLLDEPTVSLDHASTRRIAGLIGDHLASGGMVMAATHIDLGLTNARTLTLERLP
jgi:heme exporter protein A